MKTAGNQLYRALFLVLASSLTMAYAYTAYARECCTQPNHLVKSKYVNGILMPVVELPQVEIRGSRIDGHLVRGVIRGGEILIQYELPEIEISANRKSAAVSGVDIMSDPNLPLIEIQASLPVELMLPGVIADGEVLAIVDIPPVEINASETGIRLMAIVKGKEGATSDKFIPEVAENVHRETGKIANFVSRFQIYSWIRLLFQHVSTDLLPSIR